MIVDISHVSDASARAALKHSVENIPRWREEGRRFLASRMPRVPWTRIVDHIDHIADLVGVEHVGIGSDFDGALMPEGMEDCSKLPHLTEELLRRGYSPEDVKKILGENTLRVMEAVDAKSRRLQQASASR
jgi:membrane dipeptidase